MARVCYMPTMAQEKEMRLVANDPPDPQELLRESLLLCRADGAHQD